MEDTKSHKILVPVDFSVHAQAAMVLAGRLAGAFGSEIHVTHVYPDAMALESRYGPGLSEEAGLDLERKATDYFRAWQVEYCPSGAIVKEHILRGSAAKQIIALASEIDADLIVMGTRGTTGLRHVILGSVAEHVVRLADCPVLTTKGESKSDS
jgi:nucleotide-binding universal stress UspA family protein